MTVRNSQLGKVCRLVSFDIRLECKCDGCFVDSGAHSKVKCSLGLKSMKFRGSCEDCRNYETSVKLGPFGLALCEENLHFKSN